MYCNGGREPPAPSPRRIEMRSDGKGESGEGIAVRADGIDVRVDGPSGVGVLKRRAAEITGRPGRPGAGRGFGNGPGRLGPGEGRMTPSSVRQIPRPLPMSPAVAYSSVHERAGRPDAKVRS